MKWTYKVIVHDSFQIGIFAKGLYAIAEIIGSFVVILIMPEMLVNIIYRITSKGFFFDPYNWIANELVSFANAYSFNTQIFAFFYLLSHGIIKIFLVFHLWKRRLWAYPLSILVFVLFGVYQVHRYTYTHSMPLIIFTILDVIVIVLIYLEYNQVKKSHKFV